MVKKQMTFRPKLFLFRFLVGVFLAELLFLGWAFYHCTHQGANAFEVCPDLPTRSENMFGVAIATVLSLLSGTSRAQGDE